MQTPTVHLNGTSKKELLEQLKTAFEALHDAVEALSNARPHARDYYVQGDGVFAEASVEHSMRMKSLSDVKTDMIKLYNAVQGQR